MSSAPPSSIRCIRGTRFPRPGVSDGSSSPSLPLSATACLRHGRGAGRRPSSTPPLSATASRDGASSKKRDSAIDGRLYDQLVARLKFQLSAIEVRAPAILPGGSRSNGLASIAEASGVTGSNLAGADHPVFRDALAEPAAVPGSGPGGIRPRRATPGTENTKVTVSLDEPATGQSVATKTMVAGDLDEAAAAAAGYVAQHIFARDPTTPPWCVGAANGSDLAAMLLAKQERITRQIPG